MGKKARKPITTKEPRAMRAWERENGRGDAEVYEGEILPRIQEMTVPQLMKVTGLSQFHRWKVRKGDRRLHARHWAPNVSDRSPRLTDVVAER